MTFLYPYGASNEYRSGYERFSQIAQQDNAVVVSANARLIWVLSKFTVDVIDLAELANARNIDNASAQLVVAWIRGYLEAGRTVMYLVTYFELVHGTEYGNFKNDFSFFLTQVQRAFNLTVISGTSVPYPEYVIALSL